MKPHSRALFGERNAFAAAAALGDVAADDVAEEEAEEDTSRDDQDLGNDASAIAAFAAELRSTVVAALEKRGERGGVMATPRT